MSTVLGDDFSILRAMFAEEEGVDADEILRRYPDHRLERVRDTDEPTYRKWLEDAYQWKRRKAMH